MSNYVQAIVADPFGNLLAQVEGALSDISWNLNEVGGVSLTMRTNDEKWREEYFRPGGMLLLEFDNGLPAWVGLSAGNNRVRWQGKTATVAYKSAEKYLARRRTPKSMSLNKQTAGDVVAALLEGMNARRKTPLRAGELWFTSPEVRREYHYTNVYEAVQQLQADIGGDWGITGGRIPNASNQQRLDLVLNYWARRGADKPDVALIEDHNATVIDYTEQDGEMVNDWVAVGAGSSWGSSRVEGVAADAEAIATYDLWEDALVENNITSQDTLNALAAAQLARTLAPFRTLTLDVVDLAPGAFASYHIGDRVSVLCHSVGWQGLRETGRVLSRTFNANTGISRVLVHLDH